MNTNYITGGNIAAWCTKCKMELEHTIIAMVDNIPKRVKCNTCNGQHNFRLRPAEKTGTRSRNPGRKTKNQKKEYIEYMSRMAGFDSSRAKRYSTSGNYEKDEIIDHPKFGLGIVSSIIHSNKIEILFKDGHKLLIQNQ